MKPLSPPASAGGGAQGTVEWGPNFDGTPEYEPFKGKRAQRGNKLPRGFQNVSGLEPA